MPSAFTRRHFEGQAVRFQKIASGDYLLAAHELYMLRIFGKRQSMSIAAAICAQTAHQNNSSLARAYLLALVDGETDA